MSDVFYCPPYTDVPAHCCIKAQLTSNEWELYCRSRKEGIELPLAGRFYHVCANKMTRTPGVFQSLFDLIVGKHSNGGSRHISDANLPYTVRNMKLLKSYPGYKPIHPKLILQRKSTSSGTLHPPYHPGILQQINLKPDTQTICIQTDPLCDDKPRRSSNSVDTNEILGLRPESVGSNRFPDFARNGTDGYNWQRYGMSPNASDMMRMPVNRSSRNLSRNANSCNSSEIPPTERHEQQWEIADVNTDNQNDLDTTSYQTKEQMQENVKRHQRCRSNNELPEKFDNLTTKLLVKLSEMKQEHKNLSRR